MFLAHLSGSFLKSESDNRLFSCWMLVPDRAPALTIIIAAWTALHRSGTTPNVYPMSTSMYTQRLPYVILRRSFIRPSTALDDRRPGNEANIWHESWSRWCSYMVSSPCKVDVDRLGLHLPSMRQQHLKPVHRYVRLMIYWSLLTIYYKSLREGRSHTWLPPPLSEASQETELSEEN